MPNKPIIQIKTITEGHRLQQLPKPLHPLISIVDLKNIKPAEYKDVNVVMDFYIIFLKKDGIAMPYGQQTYDFDEGAMGFIAPNQVLSGPTTIPSTDRLGWMLFIHPDFFWNTTLAKKIKQFDYFEYAVNEALFLSSKEEETINDIIAKIRHELNENIDKFTQNIIVSHIETLLNYAQRYYERQFITRKITNSSLLSRIEALLDTYFKDEKQFSKGIPTVQYVAENLNVSVKYLATLLKQLTGLNTQQHIHEKLIEKAKEKLSTTELSVNEIAYELGFEHSQSFSKLFKSKVGQSPLSFRASFN